VCTANASADCYAGDVYFHDSCGNLGSLKQDCANGCSNGACVTCTSHATTKCYAGDLYWYDSCGNLEGIAQNCPGACSNNQCAAETWRCVSYPPNCTCVVTADTLAYPLLSCPSANCCFSYTSTSGPTCYCGNYDAATCDSYVGIYDGTKKSSCP
jgi:hypothetical protein